jgi:ABC-type sugar transport system permease subunit
MPTQILKEFLNDKNIESFKEFSEKVEEAKKIKEVWEKNLNEKRDEINKIKNKLEEYQTGFNFVGLYKGFENLSKDKKKEEKKLFWSLIIMGIVILAPLFVEIGISMSGLYKGQALSFERFIVVLPLLSIEIILIYFFRIILHNHRSVKVQKMQILLRQTLCQFIQSYSEYAMKIKEKDPSALEKFENLIFRGVMENPEKLPSTYDGIEQIGKLVRSMKSA